jgi:hypothetical protein
MILRLAAGQSFQASTKILEMVLSIPTLNITSRARIDEARCSNWEGRHRSSLEWLISILPPQQLSIQAYIDH